MTSSSSGSVEKIPWFGALRFGDFRRYWLGYVIVVSGQQMLWVVQAWLIYEITGSKLLLGALGLTQVVPATVLTLFGGVVADKVDQRRLLIAIQLLQMAFLTVLAALALTQVIQVWHILATVFATSAVGAFENPARQALFPHLIQRHAMTSAVALNSTVHPGTRVLGPAIAGVILAQVLGATSSAMLAAGAVFSLTALGYGVYALFLRRVHLPPVRRSSGGNVLHDMREGLRFIWRQRIFSFLIGMTYFTQMFAVSMSILFPVYAKDILEVGPSGLGLLYTGLGIGNLMGAVVAGSVGSRWHRGRLIVGGSAALGTFLVLFSLSGWFPLALLFLALAGIGSSLFNVAVQSTLQLLVPNEFRGRVMGIWGMTHTGIRPLGEMQFAAVATLFSAPIALGLGGGIVLAFVLLVAVPNRRLRELGASQVAAQMPG